MTKTAVVLHRSPALSRDEFRAAYEGAWAARGARPRAEPGLRQSCLHLPLETDALRAGTTGGQARPAACDGLTFHWWAGTPPPGDAREEPPSGAVARAETYLLEERVHWDDLGDRRRPDEASPGIKMIAFVRRRSDLSPATFRERYLEHASLARVHHPGIARYVQNFVLERWADEAPPIDAIAELHFASEADLTRRFYRDEASPEVIARDVARFLSPREGWSILAIERPVGDGAS